MSRRNFTSITESGVKKTLDSMDTCANMFILSMSGYMCYTYLGIFLLIIFLRLIVIYALVSHFLLFWIHSEHQ
ncbi:hypothetical protein Bca4012_033384 [Brassica carinata]